MQISADAAAQRRIINGEAGKGGAQGKHPPAPAKGSQGGAFVLRKRNRPKRDQKPFRAPLRDCTAMMIECRCRLCLGARLGALAASESTSRLPTRVLHCATLAGVLISRQIKKPPLPLPGSPASASPFRLARGGQRRAPGPASVSACKLAGYPARRPFVQFESSASRRPKLLIQFAGRHSP